MSRRTEFGKALISGQWATAEFEALGRLWELGLPVPYPVQLGDTEMLMELIGSHGEAAPRLAQTRPSPQLLPELFEQLRDAMTRLALHGWAHGDLSAFNLLVHRGRLVMIDLPQIVDLVANPQGPDYLHRDCEKVCKWFAGRGLETVEFEHLFGDLMAEALGSW